MQTDPGMKELWDTGMVFFNHFVRLEGDPNEGTLRQAFNRGAALFLPMNFPGCDILIPILLPEGSKMTYFVVQVKNRQNDRFTDGLRKESMDSLGKAASELGFAPPHLAMMMCLRGKMEAKGDNDEKQCHIIILHPRMREPTTRGTRQRPASAEMTCDWKDKDKLTRLVVAAVGMDQDIYPALKFCRGIECSEMAQIVEMFQKLLDCVGLSVSKVAKESPYVNRLLPLQ
ncbi:hypothetical protein VTN96DRAFT_987 [Rasamsonia emersonii]